MKYVCRPWRRNKICRVWGLAPGHTCLWQINVEMSQRARQTQKCVFSNETYDISVPVKHRKRSNDSAYTKHWKTYWCPCNNSVRPLRPPMSHIMTLWSEAPENSSLWTGSHHSAPTLPGGGGGVGHKGILVTCYFYAARACGGLLAPPAVWWRNYRDDNQKQQAVCTILPIESVCVRVFFI